MKNFYKVLGLIVIGAVSGMGLTGCNTLQSLEVSKEPTRKVFGQGQELDRSGLVVTGHFKKDSRDVTGEVQILGYDKNRPGEQVITATMKKQSATFTVTVAPVESISISQPPTVTSFKQGDEANWNGLGVAVKFANDAVPGEVVKPGTNSMTITGYEKDKAGAQTITVDYYGKRAAFEVKVVGLDSIAVTSPPKKTEYYTGEEIELAGLAVKGTWSDGSTAQLNITKNEISGYDITRGGAQNVTISYSRKTTTFPVTYVAFEALSVDRPPTKIKYELGEALNPEGIRILGTWPGHSMSIVDNSRLKITGYDPLRMGDQRITVTVGGKSDLFTVTVINPFEGVWSGQWKIGTQMVDGKSKDILEPLTLTMEGSAWRLQTRDNRGEPVELRGVYTPDSGTHAKLQCDDRKGAGDVNRDSSTVMRLRNGLIESVTLDKR
jgi:cytochrome c-type biogenesis protein CcmE